ncbi:Malate/L-lactate dehydrogenase [Aspergillus karnatakaensis]|uniref:Ldh family oxidoreductase n=1 Tax=Aspergillus karnatakaensis TaxID=1810916 RepID=UPI003CCD1CC2
MKLSIQEAHTLSHSVLESIGFSSSASTTITNHLLDSHLRGYISAGLPRLLAIRDRLSSNAPAETITTTTETTVLAHLNGNDTFGYLVGEHATELVIAKAKECGIAIVAANNTWTTGMLAYYAERAAKEDLVTIITANSTPWVAVEGGVKGVNGTNPICIGVPSSSTPVILDIATSEILHADIVLAQRLGTDLPEGSGFNAQGEPTVDPFQVFQGAIAPWGGYKGSGLASMVQLLGVMAGSPAFPPALEQFGFSIIAIDPGRFRDIGEYKREVDRYIEGVKASSSAVGGQSLRLPFERSARVREEALRSGEVVIDDVVYEQLKAIIQ